MSTSALHFRSAGELSAAVRTKLVGCRALLELYLDRVQRLDSLVNAVVVRAAERARRRADEADRALARGELWGPLHGVPMTVKESFDVSGLPTTMGLPEFRDHRPRTNAVAVDRLVAAGAVIFGKTNVPRLLADWQSYNDIYGTTHNPWDLERAPGGSSGGAAAAVAAGLTGLELGSDIGGSIRLPAHFCGIYGHKPTWGLCPLRGHGVMPESAMPDINVAGPLARSASDLALALDVLAGPDEWDAAAWRLELPAPAHEPLSSLRIAVMLDDPVAEVDEPVQTAIARLTEWLARQGARVDERARPAIDPREAFDLYVQLVRAATSVYTPADAFAAAQERAAAAPDARGYRDLMARGIALLHKDWLHLSERRHWMRRQWQAFFTEYDLMLCPPSDTLALPHDHRGDRGERTVEVNGRKKPATEHLFWAGFSGMAYLPSTVAPCGLTPDGLPTVVQIIGPAYSDRTCIAFAQTIERRYHAFTPPPRFA